MASVKVTYAARSANHRPTGLHGGRDRLCRICPRKRTASIPGSTLQAFRIFTRQRRTAPARSQATYIGIVAWKFCLRDPRPALPSCPEKNRLARPRPELMMSFSGSTDACDSGVRGRHAGLTNIKNQSGMKTENLTTNLSFPDCGSMAIIALLQLLNSIFHVLTHVKISRVLAFNIMLTYDQDMALSVTDARFQTFRHVLTACAKDSS
jgi:hypothetical protein